MKYLKKENTLEKRIRLDQKVIHAIESIALKKKVKALVLL